MEAKTGFILVLYIELNKYRQISFRREASKWESFDKNDRGRNRSEVEELEVMRP